MAGGRRRFDCRPRFDRIVVVDWSAHSTPKLGRDSIWIATLDPASPDPIHVANVSTRAAAIDLLVELTSTGADRTLLAVDWSLGYPYGTASVLDLDVAAHATPQEAIWAVVAELIDDDERNRNNRFEVASDLNRRAGGGPGPFWGCPSARSTSWLTTTRVPSAPVPTWRLVEEVLRADGLRPFSSWQLTGAGAVGSQSLLGVAALVVLRRRMAARGLAVHVWPFTTGLDLPSGGDVVVAEVWPSMFDLDATSDDGRVRDEAQVRAVASALAAVDAAGELGSWFAPDVSVLGTRVSDDRAERAEHVVVEEEGWTLGVGLAMGRSGDVGDRRARD